MTILTDNQARIQGVAILPPWTKEVRFIREIAAMHNKHTEEVAVGLIALLGAASVYMFVELCYILLQR